MNTDSNIGWNDTIRLASNASNKNFSLLEDGEYDFTVVNVEKTIFEGNSKVPRCNKAVVTLAIGNTNIKTDFLLLQGSEFRISSFYRSIGRAASNDEVVMDWDHIVGARGRAYISTKCFTGRDGREREINVVKKFLFSEVEDTNSFDEF